jgi:hypothetical protein
MQKRTGWIAQCLRLAIHYQLFDQNVQTTIVPENRPFGCARGGSGVMGSKNRKNKAEIGGK